MVYGMSPSFNCEIRKDRNYFRFTFLMSSMVPGQKQMPDKAFRRNEGEKEGEWRKRV